MLDPLRVRPGPRLTGMNSIEGVAADFDRIAALGESSESGSDRYDTLLLSLIPAESTRVLDVGCGTGRLSSAIVTNDREVLGIDISSAMIERARGKGTSRSLSFVCGDFLAWPLDDRSFDCIVSAATLHHLPIEPAIRKMVQILRPGGRLIVQDLRRADGPADAGRAYLAMAHHMAMRFMRTGRTFDPRPVRQAWARHGATDTYLTFNEAQTIVTRLLPGARVVNHWMWRFTIVWDKPAM